MAFDAPNTKVMQKSLPPNEILIDDVHILHGRMDNSISDIADQIMCNNTIDHVQSLPGNHDQPSCEDHT